MVFGVVGWKLNSSCYIWNYKSVVFKTLHHSSMSWEIRPMYLFSWNFIQFKKKKMLTKVQNSKLLTAQVKFQQIYSLVGSFCWNYIKFQLKKYRSYVSWYWRVVKMLEKNRFFVLKRTRICWILIWALNSLNILYFDWSLFSKVYNFWPKTLQWKYISWHWRIMQNSNKNWFRVWKMTWGN